MTRITYWILLVAVACSCSFAFAQDGSDPFVHLECDGEEHESGILIKSIVPSGPMANLVHAGNGSRYVAQPGDIIVLFDNKQPVNHQLLYNVVNTERKSKIRDGKIRIRMITSQGMGGFILDLNSRNRKGEQVSTETTKGIAEIERGFAFKVLKALFTQDDSGSGQTDTKDNVVVSPYGMFECLDFLHANTEGQAQSEIAKALSLSTDNGDLSRSAAELRGRLKPLQGVTPLVSQNILLFDSQYHLAPQAKSSLATSFLIKPIAADWADPKSSNIVEQQVNGLFDHVTSGRLKDFDYEIKDRQAGDVVFLNLCYFKDSWFEQFDEKLTHKATFHCADGSKPVFDFIQEKGRSGRWLENENFKLLELPYQSTTHRLGMVVVLPAEGVRVGTVIEKLRELSCLGAKATRPQWQSLAEKIDLKIPKFKIKSERSSVKEICQKLGVQSIFQDSVDSGLGSLFSSRPKLVVSDIKQESFIRFDEKGTEAAAKTEVEMKFLAMPTSPQKPNKQFVADRPFMFFLVDHAGAIYFAGQISKPEWEEKNLSKDGDKKPTNEIGHTIVPLQHSVIPKIPYDLYGRPLSPSLQQPLWTPPLTSGPMAAFLAQHRGGDAFSLDLSGFEEVEKPEFPIDGDEVHTLRRPGVSCGSEYKIVYHRSRNFFSVTFDRGFAGAKHYRSRNTAVPSTAVQVGSTTLESPSLPPIPLK